MTKETNEQKTLLKNVFKYIQSIMYFMSTVIIFKCCILITDLIIKTINGEIEIIFYGWVLVIVGFGICIVGYIMFTKFCIYENIVMSGGSKWT